MDDRELLEMAAKAAGIGPLDFDYAQREGHGLYFGPRLPMPQGVIMAAKHTYWNPLESDGDALRLANKLQIDVMHNWESVVCRWEIGRAIKQGVALDDSGNELRDEATRRAVVRAAAAIAAPPTDKGD